MEGEDKEVELHTYLSKIMLFPEDLQDKIIEDIGMLPRCTKAAVNELLASYSALKDSRIKKH
ncbi:hypothetical protein ACPUVO_09430 [Pseudocolwellia sp. HL-MZ19]